MSSRKKLPVFVRAVLIGAVAGGMSCALLSLIGSLLLLDYGHPIRARRIADSFLIGALLLGVAGGLLGLIRPAVRKNAPLQAWIGRWLGFKRVFLPGAPLAAVIYLGLSLAYDPGIPASLWSDVWVSLYLGFMTAAVLSLLAALVRWIFYAPPTLPQ